jgi:hypothetical protein
MECAGLPALWKGRERCRDGGRVRWVSEARPGDSGSKLPHSKRRRGAGVVGVWLASVVAKRMECAGLPALGEAGVLTHGKT